MDWATLLDDPAPKHLARYACGHEFAVAAPTREAADAFAARRTCRRCRGLWRAADGRDDALLNVVEEAK